MRLKRELLEKFPAAIIEKYQVSLQKILRSHESRVEAANAANASLSDDFNFDDVVLYPALSTINNLDGVGTQYAILSEQARLWAQSAGKDLATASPPSPKSLPPAILASTSTPTSTSTVINHGEVSEQVCVRGWVVCLCVGGCVSV